MDDATIAEMVSKKIWYVPTLDHNQYYVENADDIYTLASPPALRFQTMWEIPKTGPAPLAI
jgi:hypothetical protein